jgi:hypothetical protein
MNIPATFGPICFSGSLEDSNVYGRTTDDERPYGKYVKQTSSQEPLDGLESYLAEMFLARSLSSVVTFCSNRPPFKMAAVTQNSRYVKLCPPLAAILDF